MKYTALIFCALFLFACKKEKSERNQTDYKKVVVYENNPPEWSKDDVIYEVNIRQFTTDGTINAFASHLDRIKEMNVDLLWLMPIHPIGEKNRKGSLGSYYSVKDYKAVNPEFGTKEDFKNLVMQAHAKDMHIIIDWVPNHSAFDNVWVENGHKDYYTLDSNGNMQPPIGTDWWDVADLNYDNPEMRKAMIDAMVYWVKEFDIDGYRIDVVDQVPMEFFVEARAALDSIKPVFMLAESEDEKAHDTAFHMTYGWEFHHITNEIAKGEKTAVDIKDYLSRMNRRFPEQAYRMYFTSNHDENSWNGTAKERYGPAQQAMAVLCGTFEGMPLIYGGQETDLDKRIKFFDKDAIDWSQIPLSEFYTKLFGFKHAHPALWNGTYGAQPKIIMSNQQILVYQRVKDDDEVTVAINLSDKEANLKVPPALAGKYKLLFAKDDLSLTSGQEVKMAPWEYYVMYK